MQPTDRDSNGVGIPANALTLDGGSIRGRASPNLDADLSHAALSDDASRKVDGGGVAPTFLSSGTFTVQENTTAVGTVRATDSDPGDRVTGYRISGGADAVLFSITNDGVLSFLNAPDFEDPQGGAADDSNDYEVTVEATSGSGRGRKSATQALTVTVTDEAEDEAPAAMVTPGEPTFGAATATSLEVNWPGATSGGLPDGYTVQWRETGEPEPADGTQKIAGTFSNGAWTATVIGLDFDISYDVRLRASNTHGQSEWGPWATARTAENSPPAFAETGYSFSMAENVDGRQSPVLVGTVTATDVDGDTVYYLLQGKDADGFYIDGEGNLTYIRGGELAKNFTDPHHAFSMTVRATDGFDHAEVPLTVGLTGSILVPNAPTQLVFTSQTVNSVEVDWGVRPKRGAPIIGFDVEYRVDGGGGEWLDAGHTGTDTIYALSDLEPGTAYQVRVRAKSTGGESPWSDSLIANTLEERPRTPLQPILGFTLLDSRDKTDIGGLKNGDVLEASPVPLEIRAEIHPLFRNVRSVAFALSGPASQTRTENSAPFELYGGRSGGAVLTPGSYTLTATPYTRKRLRGAALQPLTVSFTVEGAALSVADAQVAEGAGAALAFVVTLDRAVAWPVTVDYATSDGTAQAGTDYTVESGVVTFAPGQTRKTVSVTVLDDAHDDDGETLTLTLSNPLPSGVVRLGDATATGTIRNSDPLQRAWLARFGRTVADQVVDAVRARIEAGSDAKAHITLAGERIGLDAAANRPALAEWEAKARLVVNGDRFGDEWHRENRKRDRAVAGRELLTGSSFLLRLNAADDGTSPGANAPSWTLWGRGALTRFEGRDGKLTLDGEVASGMVGVDRAAGRLTLGLMLSHSMGDGEYRQGDDSGDIESTLTGLYPYGRYEASKWLSLWGVAGYGEGELTLTQKGSQRYEADMDLAMGAIGARAVVFDPGADGGLELAVKPDAMAVRTTSEGAGPNLRGAESTVTRLRLGLEGMWRGAGGLVPRVELALRHDGGDAETGFGVEAGGGLAFSDRSSGLKAELRGRALIAHADDDYREWGIGGSLALDPGAQGRGLSFALRPAWGRNGSATERLLGGDPLTGLAANDNAAHGRLDAEIGYGLPAFGGRFTATPHAGFSLGETAREYRLGWRLGLAGGGAGTLDLNLEATRREPANDDGPEHVFGFKVRAAW